MGGIALNKILFGDIPGFDLNPKYAYAASFGKSLPGNTSYQHFKPYIAASLAKFRLISLREPDWLNELTALQLPCAPITVALDPALLLDAPQHAGFTRRPMLSEPYVLLYLFGPHYGATESQMHTVLDCIANYRRALGLANLAVLDISPGPIFTNAALQQHAAKLKLRYVWRFATSPQEFVSFAAYSSLSLTNSFHCAVFSLIFGRPFMYCFLHAHDPRMRFLENSFGMAALQLDPDLAADCVALQQRVAGVHARFTQELPRMRAHSIALLQRIILDEP